MNWDAIGAFAELLGSIAVLVTIIYLARQIKQNSDIARVDAYRDMQKQWSEMRERTMDRDNLDVITRGLQGMANLDDYEKVRFLKLMGDEFAFLDTVMLMERKGLLDAEYEVVEKFGAYYKNVLKQPGALEFWDTIKDGTSPYLVEWVEKNSNN